MTVSESEAVLVFATRSMVRRWTLTDDAARAALHDTACELSVAVGDLAALVVAGNSLDTHGQVTASRAVEADGGGRVTAVVGGSRRDCRMLTLIALARGVTADCRTGSVTMSCGYDVTGSATFRAASAAVQDLVDLALNSRMCLIRGPGE